jgi:predicted RNase H-like nuclease
VVVAGEEVRLLGVDLAWGSRARTGLAALDGRGRLLDLRDVRSDEEIVDWARALAPGPCVVAIDAPVVVRNPTGARECERLVTRFFGRHHAGAHPANTGNPAFAGGSTRALRLTDRLALDVDPRSGAARRALEVFPHPTTVALFDLPSVVRYKHKAGRDLQLLGRETRMLLDLLEGLADADPRLSVTDHSGWTAVRSTVGSATRKSDLRRVEDRIDAVICAYVALLALRSPDRLHVFGDAASGYIVTPLTPGIASRVAADDLAPGNIGSLAAP